MKTYWHTDKPEGELSYAFAESNYGTMLVAWVHNRLCYLGFTDSLDDIEQRWPKAKLSEADGRYGLVINEGQHPPMALYGTPFEHKVWLELMNIPKGKTCSYGELAAAIGKPMAQRAVASAIGRNPISLLVPCHRVLRSSGALGGYHWGLEIKRQLLAAENKN